jgi:hypothetical protein
MRRASKCIFVWIAANSAFRSSDEPFSIRPRHFRRPAFLPESLRKTKLSLSKFNTHRSIKTCLDGTEHYFEFEKESFKGQELLYKLACIPGISPRRCSLLFEREEVDPNRDFKPEDFNEGSPFVLFDFERFREKSYPQVDRGFPFEGTRYCELTQSVQSQSQAGREFRPPADRQEQILMDLELGMRFARRHLRQALLGEEGEMELEPDEVDLHWGLGRGPFGRVSLVEDGEGDFEPEEAVVYPRRIPDEVDPRFLPDRAEVERMANELFDG